MNYNFCLDVEHKISSILFLCFVVNNASLCTEDVVPEDKIAS